MYWRVRKITPDQVLRQYSLQLILLVSIIGNLVLLVKVVTKPPLPESQKMSFDMFARQVTMHLFDANYLTFEDSMKALLTKELGPSVKTQQMQSGFIPKSEAETKALTQQMADKKSVSCVKFDEVKVGTPDNSNMVPVEVRMQILTQTEEGADGPQRFKVQYLIGQRKDNQEPIVAKMTVGQLNAASAP